MAMARRDSVHQSAAGGFVCSVERQEFQSSFGTNGIMQRISFSFHNVGGDHGSTFMKQRKSYCAAQSAGTTGNESYFVANLLVMRASSCCKLIQKGSL